MVGIITANEGPIPGCEEDSLDAYSKFSTPGKDVVCINITLEGNTSLTSEYKSWSIRTVQLISTKGALSSKTLEGYSLVANVLIYKSNISEFSLTMHFLQSLLVMESIFPNVTRENFSSMYFLFSLAFHSNLGVTFEENCFHDLVFLKNLTIFNQTFTKITPNTFKHLKELQTLVLNANGLRHIHKNSFLNLEMLRELNLENNPIEYFKINVSGLTRLEKLYLINTNITNFNIPFFYPLRHMNTLGLPSSCWLTLKLPELAIGFPNLRTVLINELDKNTANLTEEIDMMEYAQLVVKRVKKVDPIDTSILIEYIHIFFH
ncbi:leucine-rich repeat-containing protein 15-like isoform X2 [Diabrotica virgifera virgifera]|nr:leucine-rich repeat-containing protein 15-like isoform X2 [Diabrotica virgifera virgifera]